jgi:hypothetical protein
LAASIGKKWAILRDVILNHNKSVDGASISVPHVSPTTGNAWNNLLCGRNALEFIHDPEAIFAGLGYEECNGIMMHRKEAYDQNENSLNITLLQNAIRKYFYLTEDELNYSSI